MGTSSWLVDVDVASMKCSSRRNCNPPPGRGWRTFLASLNEVQFPKELQRHRTPSRQPWPRRLNEVQFPKELQLVFVAIMIQAYFASMKCSSRRNCNGVGLDGLGLLNQPQ